MDKTAEMQKLYLCFNGSSQKALPLDSNCLHVSALQLNTIDLFILLMNERINHKWSPEPTQINGAHSEKPKE